MSPGEPRSPWNWLRSQWRRKVGIRLVTIVIAVSLLLGALASYLNYRVEARESREQLLAYGAAVARVAAIACPDAVLSSDDTMLEAFVAALVAGDRSVDFARIVRSRDDKVLAQFPTHRDATADDDHLVLPPTGILTSQGGDEVGRIVIGLSMVPVRAALQHRVLTLFAYSTLTCLSVAVVLLVVLRILVVEPLRRLDAEAQRLARGELEAALLDLGETELGRLGRSMEEMRRNLRHSHESLATQNQALRTLDQLKSQFLANMSHEIRTPISSILGSIELLQDPSTSEAERREFLSALQGNGTHLLDLVNTLLDFSKIESGNLILESVPCRIADTVREVTACVLPMAQRRRLELLVQMDAAVPEWIETDPTRLRQILINVLGNAIKFTERGSVQLSVRPAGDAVTPLLQLRVIDTGIGIPADVQERVFEPFNQGDTSTTRRFGGTGLGLSIARKLARRLGGDIAIDSVVGRGTCITVTIAAQAVASPADRAGGVGMPAGCFRGRVLLAEDSPDNQRLLSTILRRPGVEVDIAGNGRLAVEAAESQRLAGRGYDLILMDLQMPEMDGLSAIRWLRQHHHEGPIVALTAHAMAEDRDNCLAAGSDAYETKPISRARLLGVLANYLPSATAGAAAPSGRS